jgi:hypothetical protein
MSRHREHSSVRLRRLALVLFVALLLGVTLVHQASSAAFRDVAGSTGNMWTAGTVSLDDDATAPLFGDVTGLTPASAGSRCIAITYTGDVSAEVSLYGVTGGTLAPYLNLTVEQGTGGTFGGGDPCSGFTPIGGAVYSGTLAGFGGHDGFAAGVPAAATDRWHPAAAGDTRVYRFSYTIADDANAQSTDATASFTWEARTA